MGKRRMSESALLSLVVEDRIGRFPSVFEWVRDLAKRLPTIPECTSWQLCPRYQPKQLHTSSDTESMAESIGPKYNLSPLRLNREYVEALIKGGITDWQMLGRMTSKDVMECTGFGHKQMKLLVWHLYYHCRAYLAPIIDDDSQDDPEERKRRQEEEFARWIVKDKPSWRPLSER